MSKMGAVLAFPSVSRDYTDNFSEWKQQHFRSLPDRMKSVIRRHERAWEKKLKQNMDTPLIEIVNVTNEVHPGIFIGSYSSVLDESLEKHSIDVVLNMARECEYSLHPQNICVQLVKIGIDDGRLANCGVFEKAADVIAEARREDKVILIHCAAGVSRSATAVLTYLMLHEDFGWADALCHVQESRPCLNPHPLLVRSLMRDLGGRFIP
jgi:predicted protein tyrosine phosphatase